MSAPQLDDLDRQLIEVLARDARVSNRKIAGDLGVTEGTVRGRIKRLQQDGLISFTAITSFGMAAFDPHGVYRCSGRSERGARRCPPALPNLEAVNAVMITMGRFNVLAICLFDSLDGLLELSSDQILAIAGRAPRRNVDRGENRQIQRPGGADHRNRCRLRRQRLTCLRKI
jgi:DNA-binding Lrp family transcriptional regulator